MKKPEKIFLMLLVSNEMSANTFGWTTPRPNNLVGCKAINDRTLGSFLTTCYSTTQDSGIVENETTEEASLPAAASAEGDSSGKSKRVYVGNLAWTVSWQDLKDHFKTVGHEITRADVMQNRDGRSRGCGTVDFATVEGAEQAVLTLNATEFKGREILVREFKEEQREKSTFSSDENAQSRRVYVGNLNWKVKWQDLKDYMNKAGNVAHAEIICESTGRSKGCGVVEYATAEEASKAIETLADTEFMGRMIFVREDRGGWGEATEAKEKQEKQIYVSNISPNTDWQQIKDHFKQVGEVDRVNARPGKFALVRFHNKEDAGKAVETLNGSELDGFKLEIRMDRKA